MKSKVETYALTVCFASVVCLIISGGFAIFGLLQVAAPGLMMRTWSHTMLQSNDEYWQFESMPSRGDGALRPRPPEAELTKERELAYAIAVWEERRDGLQILLRALAFAGAGGIALLLHWRLARRFRSDIASS
jgi:hypothetical protein